MKILLVHNRYLSKYMGGEDRVFINETAALELVLGKENVFQHTVSNDQINKIKLLATIWFSFYHYKKISRIIRENNIDIVHVHNYFPLLTPSVFTAARRNGASTIQTLHNYRWWCVAGILYRDGVGICEHCIDKKFTILPIKSGCYRNSKLQTLIAIMAMLCYKIMRIDNLIDYYFVLTPFQKNKIISFGVPPEKLVLKPNFIHINEKIISEKSKSGFIYVGRLEESKGIEILLESWAMLRTMEKLHIVGSGPLEQELKQRYQGKNIRFYGSVQNENVLKLIMKSKYLIQPSVLYETFGLTIIEAMSVGTPVIGFNIGTRNNLIKNKYNGFLCNPGNLGETLEQAIHYKNYLTLVKNAKLTAKKYNESIIVKEQIVVYKKIIKTYGTGIR